MVYSVRSNRPIISSKPLKTKRRKSDFVKKNEEFLRTHKVDCDLDASGNPVIIITERNG